MDWLRNQGLEYVEAPGYKLFWFKLGDFFSSSIKLYEHPKKYKIAGYRISNSEKRQGYFGVVKLWSSLTNFPETGTWAYSLFERNKGVM